MFRTTDQLQYAVWWSFLRLNMKAGMSYAVFVFSTESVFLLDPNLRHGKIDGTGWIRKGSTHLKNLDDPTTLSHVERLEVAEGPASCLPF